MKHPAGGIHHALFAPIDTEPRVEVVVRRLSDVIALGLLADGEQLPGESDLASRLGVSTVTLREALMALRQQGLVVTRRGRRGGSFVCAPPDTLGERLNRRLAAHGTEELRDLGDHYAAVAGAAAALAADRADDHDLEPVRRSLAEFARTSDPTARGRIDGRLRVEVAAASQSARLTRAEIGFQTELGALSCLVYAEEATYLAAAERHCDLMKALTTGDGAAARTVAEEHVGVGMARLIELRLELNC